MASARRLARHPLAVAVLSLLAAGYIRLVWLTGRWRIENAETATEMVRAGQPFIGCFWHGRMLMIPNAWRMRAPMRILISRHRDGLFISRTLRYLGIGTIAGSSSRGGAAALMSIVRALRGGEYVGITPDGPRGPRMRAAPGAVAAAKLSGAPLVPVSYSASRRRILSSWDRFMLPLPFARGIVRIGAPIEVPQSADENELERVRRQLEETLIALTQTLDAELGVQVVEPAAETGAEASAGDLQATETLN